MGILEVLAWIVFGGLAGWIASIIVGKDSKLGIPGNVVVGIVGAFIGGWLLPNDSDQFDFGSFVAAIIGAVLLLLVVSAIVSAIDRNRRTRL